MENHRGDAYSRYSFVEGEAASTRPVAAAVGAPNQCCPACLVGEVLQLSTCTPNVEVVDATGMFDSAVVLRESRMIGAVVVAAEMEHYRLESQDQRRGRVAAELGQPHRVIARAV